MGTEFVSVLPAVFLLISLAHVTLEYQSCGKGSFWNTDKQACEKCDIGSYQDMLGNYDNTSCKQCPAMTTTWIKGATHLLYCRPDCPPGSEYNFQNKNCTLCPAGQFRNSTLQSCYRCPEDYVTDKPGSTECNHSQISYNIFKVNQTIDVPFNLGECQTISRNSYAVSQSIVSLMRHQHRRFPQLCPTDTCDSIRVSYKDTCFDVVGDVPLSDNEGARAEIDILNTDNFLLDSTVNLYRRLESVLFDAFYDLTIINDSLAMFQGCSEGQVLKLYGSCEPCKEGYFANINSYQCEVCPRHTYSSKPVKDSCTKCPSDTQTASPGSTKASQCEAVTDRSTIIIAACAGGAGLLCVILVVIVIIVCCKRRHSQEEDIKKKQSQSQSINNLEHGKRAKPNRYVHPDMPTQQQYFYGSQNTDDYSYGRFGYNLPSYRNWDTDSLHDYKNPGYVTDYLTPVQPPPEEIYDEIED